MRMPKAKRGRLEIVPSDHPAGDDKRTFCRFVLPDVPLRLKDLKAGGKVQGVCKDIGGGGAGIECVEEIKPRTPLELWFDLPDGFEPLHLLGKAAWSKAQAGLWRLGVAFDKQKLMDIARVLKISSLDDMKTA